MAGRPKRSLLELEVLLAAEAQWEKILQGLRQGIRSADNSLPDLGPIVAKWPASKPISNTETRLAYEKNRLVWLNDDIEKAVCAPPRDFPPEPEHWRALSKRYTTASEIRSVCEQSAILRWVNDETAIIAIYNIPPRGWIKSKIQSIRERYQDTGALWQEFGSSLYRHAGRFCAAKKDARYPRSKKRKSSEGKRAKHLARVLAGFTILPPNRSGSTAVDILRKVSRGKIPHRA